MGQRMHWIMRSLIIVWFILASTTILIAICGVINGTKNIFILVIEILYLSVIGWIILLVYKGGNNG
jgi:hypothetical protein